MFTLLEVILIIVCFCFLGGIIYLIQRSNSLKKKVERAQLFENQEKRHLAEFFLLNGVKAIMYVEHIHIPKDARLRVKIFQKLGRELHTFLREPLDNPAPLDNSIPLVKYFDNFDQLSDIIHSWIKKTGDRDITESLYNEFIEFYIKKHGHVDAEILNKEILAIQSTISDKSVDWMERKDLLEEFSSMIKERGGYLQKIFSHELLKEEIFFAEIAGTVPLLQKELGKAA